MSEKLGQRISGLLDKGRKKSRPPRPEFRVIVPILNPNLAEDMVQLATAFAGVSAKDNPYQAKIVVLSVVIVPEETPLSQGANLVKAYREMQRYVKLENNERMEVRTEVRVARDVAQAIREQVQEDKADLLLLHWKGETETPGAVFGTTIDRLMQDPPCDIVLARFATLPKPKSIMLPMRGSNYSSLAFKLAGRMAEYWNAELTVLHSMPAVLPTTSEAYGPAFVDANTSTSTDNVQTMYNDLPPTARLLTLRGQPTSTIIHEAAFYDLVVMGASPGLENQSIVERIAHQTHKPLLVVKAYRTPGTTISTPHKSADSLGETVDRWYAENIFHYREFRSMSSLTLLKERNDKSLSLVFPVYGPSQPVALADTVKRAWFALMRDPTLVDEIIVSAPGAQFDQEEVNLLRSGDLPEVRYVGPDSRDKSNLASGPGEALWHALRAARGDIIVWADPQAVGFEARHIYGLVGPLLRHPEFALTVGFFSDGDDEFAKPVSDSLSELSIRPLLGGFFPELAGVINPLGLMGAARREHLERFRLFTGQGFTIGLLIDMLKQNGLMSVAQVNLGTLVGNTCPIVPQRITAEIMEVLLRRASEHLQNHLVQQFDTSVKTVHRTEGTYSLHVQSSPAHVRELPAILYMPGYQRHSFG